jgi:molybdopterin-guanine dinucleotide biosynthesis protein A
MNPITIRASQVFAVVLAGGRALRMGGADKGLQTLHGEALATIAIRRLCEQSIGRPGHIAVSANRNLAQYAALKVPVLSDTVPDFAGPLAGMLSALQHCQGQADYLLTVPCDSPRFPLNLLERLSAALVAEHADIAIALAPDTDPGAARVLRRQPVFCLMRSNLAQDLAAFLQMGGRKIGAWTERHATALVPFDTTQDDPRAFANANTLDELHQLESP